MLDLVHRRGVARMVVDVAAARVFVECRLRCKGYLGHAQHLAKRSDCPEHGFDGIGLPCFEPHGLYARWDMMRHWRDRMNPRRMHSHSLCNILSRKYSDPWRAAAPRRLLMV